MATIRRAANGRRVLDFCQSESAGREAQRQAIAGWFAHDRGASGPVSTLLDPADYQLLLVESPDVLPAELKAAVKWRLKDTIDFPVEEAVVDVFEIPEPARRTGAKKMYAIAARRQAVEAAVMALRPAARRFDVIDIQELALRNLASLLPEAEGGLILLWLRPDSAQLLVIKQGTLYLTRQVHFNQRDVPEGASAAPDVDAISLELQRSMDYFESHYAQTPIGHLVVAPGGELAEGLARALGNETSMRTQCIDLGAVLDMEVPLDATDARSLLAVGAALRDDQKKL